MSKRALARIDVDQVEGLLATLYGLHTVLRLHFTQEEQNYFALADTDQVPESGITAPRPVRHGAPV
ncbi:hypothetical protein [Saccharopolyspora sp. NPDC049357]|uniref:hypothetical protein n=1 Tax=Saccharopolyspora sp. NPDC049357 TaxID=3154507 RepID=UPI003424DAC6